MADLQVRFPKPCDAAWEAMTPSGCGRLCDRCDTVVHDLSHYALEEVEALLRANPGACVRARIDAEGAVALKAGAATSKRRMVMAAALTAGLLAAGDPAFAKPDRPAGEIVGSIEQSYWRVKVTATGEDGTRFRTTARRGRYRIGHVPPGNYKLTFVPDCGDTWTVDKIVVRAGQTQVPNTQGPSECIIVGMLQIEHSPG